MCAYAGPFSYKMCLILLFPKGKLYKYHILKVKKKQVSAQVKWTYCAELLVLSQVDGKKYSLENKKFNYNKKKHTNGTKEGNE